MKITMIALGSTGDVRPYILLGRELKARGHEITLTTFTDFRESIEEAGLRFHPVAGDAHEIIGKLISPKSKGPNYLVEADKALKDIAPTVLRELLHSCEDAEAMICTFFGTMYYSIAEKYNIPCIQTQYYPMDPTDAMPISAAPGQRLGRAWNRTTYRVGYLLIGLVERHLLTAWRKENGMQQRKLRGSPDYQVNGHRVPVVYAVSPLVMPRPANWDEHIHLSGYWFDEDPAPYTPPADLEAFLSGGEKPIYIGFGSMNSGNMRKTFYTVLKAVRKAKVRAIINCGWSGEHLENAATGRLYFAEAIPHSWLFPRVSAVVHHGGAGTTAAGLLAGKPTLVIPFGGDQPFWANRVYELGCGPKPIPRDSITVAKLTKALIELHTRARYRTTAEELAAYLNREHGLSRAADIIEEELRNWRDTPNA